MTFPAGTGIIAPEELDVLQNVYSSISPEDWFTCSKDRREQFASYVIELYRSGVCDPRSLALQCRSLALVRFGNGGLAH